MTAAKNAPDLLGTSVAGLVALLRVENAKMHEDAIARGTRSGGERRRRETEWFKTRGTKSIAHIKAEAIETQAVHGAWSALRDLVVTVRTAKAGTEAVLSYFLAATEEFERDDLCRLFLLSFAGAIAA